MGRTQRVCHGRLPLKLAPELLRFRPTKPSRSARRVAWSESGARDGIRPLCGRLTERALCLNDRASEAWLLVHDGSGGAQIGNLGF